MEEHCPEPGLPALGDYVIVAQALSQVKSVETCHRNRMDLKSDSIGRGWLHIDPGQSENGSTLTTSVDVGRIQGV